ncbi:MAG: helix-turn-helix domain-containing protein [Clostridia bacterium]|nr:helix-turn-helix domain-containing protein [Clostridia bacterium]
MSDKFTKIEFQNSFSAINLTTLFYMEIPKDFSYGGESHDFWEMVYIDKGEMICTAGKKQFILKSGELTFHKPDEYHNLSGNGRNSSNISVLTFDCFGGEMDYFEGKIFRLNAEEKNLLAMLFGEGIEALEKENERDPLAQSMKVRTGAPFGYSQMIKNLLEIFLIKLRRNTDIFSKESRRQFTVDGVNIPVRIKSVVDYLNENVYGKITISDISKKFGISESLLKKEFSIYYRGGIINYYNKRKAEEAKKLIRNGERSFSEIADLLGFDNPQYFSKFFKTITNMTPTEYKNSIIS